MLPIVAERFEATTTVRQPRVALMWTAVGLMVALMVGSALLRAFVGKEWAPLMQAPYWVIGPIIAAIQRRPKIETLPVEATAEGIRVGKKLVTRASMKTALMRREAEKTWVVMRGWGLTGAHVDVEVKDDAEADRLCSALGLDAKTTVAEFALTRPNLGIGKPVLLVMVAFMVAAFAAISIHAMIAPLVILALAILLAVVGVPLLALHHRVKLRVGADGVVIKEGLTRSRFVTHDEIESVRAAENTVLLQTKRETMRFDVGARRKNKKQIQEDLARQAESVAWRIEKSRQAYLALAGEAPQAALALDRGEKSVGEWIEQLKRVGQGANATFRDVGLTREQLMRVVESTSAAAKERLAAVVALRDGLTEDEKPRIRVAADRCVEPAMRERMVRVAFAPDEELVEAISESDADVAQR
jgi:hypothetical protein